MFRNNGALIKIFSVFVIMAFAQISTNAITDLNNDDIFHAPNITNGSVLNIKDCIALAFKNSPNIRRKKYELDIAKSNVGLAKSRYFPTLGAGVGFNYERNSNSIYYNKKYRDLPQVSVFINQMVYDFGKTTSFIKMEKFFEIGAEYEFVDEICRTLFDIKAKYYELLKASAILEIGKKDVELSKELLKISKNGVDKLTAKIYIIDAEGELTKAEQEYNNAKLNLSNAMYLDNKIDYTIKETGTFEYDINKDMTLKGFKPVVFSFKNEEAAEIAYKNSPDLQVIINTKSAMEESLKYIKRSYFPELTAGVGYNFNNTYEASNNSLQVGVGLSSSVNLKELKHNIDIARSEADIADNEIGLFKKDLYFEVQRALNNVDANERQIPDTQVEIEEARKNLELVKKGYLANKLDYTALQNAKKDFIRINKDYIGFIFEYNMALIQTEMAMHYHMVDIHHKADHAIHNHADELIEHLNDVLNCDEKERKDKKKKKRK